VVPCFPRKTELNSNTCSRTAIIPERSFSWPAKANSTCVSALYYPAVRSSNFSARTRRRESSRILIIYDTHRAWHASLPGLEAVQSSRSPVLLRVAAMNCGAIEFAVKIPLSIDTFLLYGGRSVSVR
jgi:hypothetical protein